MILVSFIAALLHFALPAETALPHTSFKNPIPKTVPATLNKSIMLQLVNKVRQTGCKCGDTYYKPVPAVSWNAQLEEAAYNHSLNMQADNFFSHVGPDGARGGRRIEAVGYNWKAYGENIATGYKSEREVVEGWIKSPGHCKNIMNKMYKEMGVARVGNYWTQELASK
jgi:uncharacterized protein YkwD